jgi:hypothetical protein
MARQILSQVTPGQRQAVINAQKTPQMSKPLVVKAPAVRPIPPGMTAPRMSPQALPNPAAPMRGATTPIPQGMSAPMEGMDKMGAAGGGMSPIPQGMSAPMEGMDKMGAAGGGMSGVPPSFGGPPMGSDIASRGGFDPWAASRAGGMQSQMASLMGGQAQGFGGGAQTMEHALPSGNSVGRQRLAQLMMRGGSR